MRLRLTDESWVWLRAEDFAYSQLRVTDENYQILRVTGEVAALHRVTGLRTRYAILLKPRDSVAAADRIPTHFTFVWKPDFVASSDYQNFAFVAGLKDTALTTERLAWTVTMKLKDIALAVDKPFFIASVPFYSSFDVDDKPYLDMVVVAKSSSASSDKASTVFSAVVKDVAPATDFSAWTMYGKLVSAAASLDAVSITFRAGLFDIASTSDRVSSTLVFLLKDSVTAGSVFTLDGLWFMDTADNVFSSDAFYSTLVDPSADAVGATDTIVIGVRLAIDFYFGGLVLGGSPFGGRIV